MMDYSCGKFDDCSFSNFGSIMRTNRHTDTHTCTQTDVNQRCTRVTLVVVSNYDSDKMLLTICVTVSYSYKIKEEVRLNLLPG